ncbi:MAG: chromosomal replication initiator protein DnaA [Paludibacteraceae bacterium]|nr:chromosomal replication initiator protein DnaA [Paludibacteraceae bacterium]
MNQMETYWQECLQILRDNLSGSAYRTWFEPIVPLEYENKVLVLQVKSQYVVEYIEENYIDLLGKVLVRVFGRGIRLEYRVLIDSRSGAGSTIPSEGVEQLPKRSLTGERYEIRREVGVSDLDSQLNSQLTFGNFVEGECNKLSRTAGVTIATSPGKTIFNPLFIFGGSGVGKTHLLNAIGNMIKQEHPGKRVLYVSANTFMVQYQDAVVNNKVNDFVNFYQTVDVLLVDDIQYWADKKGTQNTFFFIFNHLHQSGKQLVLTSDKSPVELKGLEDRLITRFKWGLLAEIKKPDFQLRKDILKSRIYHDGLDISEDIINYIAENVRDNIRDLEGVLASLLAHSTLANQQINMELTEQIVSRIVELKSPDMTLDHITEVVCEHFGIDAKQLYAQSRKREIAQARQVAMYMAKKLTECPLVEIGKKMGGRNHATVLHAIRTVTEQIEYDAFLRRSVKQIENQLMN